MNKFRKSLLVTALMVAGVNSANAIPLDVLANPTVTTTNNDFTMLNADGAKTGGNNVDFAWDGTYLADPNGAFNATLAPACLIADCSTGRETFFGYTWTAHNVRILAPGTYNVEGYQLTVGAGQVGLAMLFDWGANADIGVVEVCQPGKFNGGVADWNCASVNSNGPNINGLLLPGVPMNNGPFPDFNANFSLNGLFVAGQSSSAGVTINAGPGVVGASQVVAKATLGTPAGGMQIFDGLNYTITGVVGGSADLKLTFNASIVGKTLYKVSGGTFTAIPESSFTRLGDDVSVTMVVADCVAAPCTGYDTDPAAGTITDPIAPGFPAAPPASIGASGGGGGCTVDPKGGSDASLLAVLLASLGYLGWRRRRS